MNYPTKISATKGFVLLTILIYMQILSQLALLGLMNLSLLTKQNRQEWQRKEEKLKAKIILSLLEKKITKEPSYCHHRLQSNLFLMKRPFSWWKEKGCNGNFEGISYYYISEQLGEVNCAQEAHTALMYNITYHRITLFMPLTHLSQGRILLQSIIAIIQHPVSNCSQVNQIVLGRQAWREL